MCGYTVEISAIPACWMPTPDKQAASKQSAEKPQTLVAGGICSCLSYHLEYCRSILSPAGRLQFFVTQWQEITVDQTIELCYWL